MDKERERESDIAAFCWGPRFVSRSQIRREKDGKQSVVGRREIEIGRVNSVLAKLTGASRALSRGNRSNGG